MRQDCRRRGQNSVKSSDVPGDESFLIHRCKLDFVGAKDFPPVFFA